MNFPKSRKTHVAMAIGVAATTALVIVGPGSTAATAGRLLGSASIRDNSIRSIDITTEPSAVRTSRTAP